VQRAISEGAGSDVQGAAAAQLAQQARSAAAQRFAALDANPAMRAAVSDMPPDKFLSSYVMQGNEGDIKQMMSSLQAQSPAQAEALQNSMMRHLKGVATGFRPDDKAVVSEAAMNQMVNNPNSAARNKALFGPQKFGQLQQLADVVGDMKWAPVASAINTSNTAATGANFVKSTVQGGPLNALLSGAKIVPGLSGAAGAAQQSLQSSRAAGLVGQTMAHSVGEVPKNIPLSALMKQGVDQLAAPAGAIAAGSRRRQPQQ